MIHARLTYRATYALNTNDFCKLVGKKEHLGRRRPDVARGTDKAEEEVRGQPTVELEDNEVSMEAHKMLRMSLLGPCGYGPQKARQIPGGSAHPQFCWWDFEPPLGYWV